MTVERDQPGEPGNFWAGDKFYMVRCYTCTDGVRGRENYIPAAATGQCAWCGHVGPKEA